jgi:hypothetical protein
MTYYTNPLSFGLNSFDITNLSNSFPPMRVQQPQYQTQQPQYQNQQPQYQTQHQQQIDINILTTEIHLLNTKIKQLESSKAEQDNDQERIMSHNKEVLDMCRTLIAEKQDLQSKYDTTVQNAKDERNHLDVYIVDMQCQIGILENKLSEMQVKAMSEFENSSLKQENERLKAENSRFSKSNAFWILKIYKFLLTSRLKHKYTVEINRMRDTIIDDYTKTGRFVERTKSIIEEYFSMEHK